MFSENSKLQKQLIVALALIVDKNNNVLISQRNQISIPKAHGLWDLPGGKIEFGEDPKETVIREIYEELNIDIAVISFLPTYISSVWEAKSHIQHVICLPFVCKIIAGTVKINTNAIMKIAWINKVTLHNYSFLTGDKECILKYYETSHCNK